MVTVVLLLLQVALLMMMTCTAHRQEGLPSHSPPLLSTTTTRNLVSTDGMDVVKPSFEFQLPTNFFDQKCDPCIARDDYVIQVLIHTQAAQLDHEVEHLTVGSSQQEELLSFDSTKYWAQVQSAMEQASRDTNIRLEFFYFDHTGSGGTEAAANAMINHLLHISQEAGIVYSTGGTGGGDPIPFSTITTTTTTPNHPQRSKQEPQGTLPNAIIVGLPATPYPSMEHAVLEVLKAGVPVFGFGAGYSQALGLKILGFVAQDEFVAGEMVAQEIMDQLNVTDLVGFIGSEDDEDDIRNRDNAAFVDEDDKKEIRLRALFVGTVHDRVFQQRFKGMKKTFDNFNFFHNYDFLEDMDVSWTTETQANETKTTLDESTFNRDEINATTVQINVQAATLWSSMDETASKRNNFDDSNEREAFAAIQISPEDVFQNCEYDIIIINGAATADVIMDAYDDRCAARLELGGPHIATFGSSPQIRRGMLAGEIAFAATPQQYLQSVFVVLMASVYVTTGKKLALPIDDSDHRIYLSGPSIIRPQFYNKLPEDSIVNCEEYAFPVCDPDEDYRKPYDSPIVALAPPLPAGGIRICNADGCIRRHAFRFACVTHGVTTSLFWGPIFAGARQAAKDLGVELDMEPFQPQPNRDIMYAKMGARIVNACESGVDGIIISIPHESLIESIQICLQLSVPVVSINSGAEIAEELGLLHIGQMEYNAGYQGGLRLAKEGMREGYCLNHSPGQISLNERCRGFEDAIATLEGVVYGGHALVAGDDVTRYTLAVEEAVEKASGLGSISPSWEGIGLLSLTVSNLDAALAVQELHPDALLGTFDVRDSIYEPLADGRLKFGIDQQALLQGILPVHLLAYAASSKQSIVNNVVESGPHMVVAPPTIGRQVCEADNFNVCLEIQYEEMNLLPQSVVVAGYCMVALTFFFSAVCVAWTCRYWQKSELVRVSQPPFLLMLITGVVISTLSIIFMAVETEYPTLKSIYTGTPTNETNPDIDRVNASCMAVPWLDSLGSAIVFTSLFSKIWKIQKIYRAGERFRRVQVGLWDILPYATVLMTIVLSLLISWQIYDPFKWVRTPVLEDKDGLPLESTAECTSDDGWYFWIALLAFHVLYLIYALVLCWQTKDIPGDFSEGNYVSLCVFCIFQVAVLAIPIAAMVRDNSTAFYFVRACAIFLQNFIVLALIFGPKMWRVSTGTDQLSIRDRSSKFSIMSFDDLPTNNPWSNGDRRSSQFSLPRVNEELSSDNLELREENPMESEIKELQRELDDLRKDRDSLRSQSDNTSHVKSLTEEMEDLRRESQQASSDHASQVQELERNIVELKRENEALKSQKQDNSEWAHLLKENAELKSQIAELKGAKVRMI